METLKNRKRLQITLPNELVIWLKNYSEETCIPISRIVEKLLNKLKKEGE